MRRLRAFVAAAVLAATVVPLSAFGADYTGYALVWSRHSAGGKAQVAVFAIDGVATGYNASRPLDKRIHFNKTIAEYVRLIDDFYDKHPDARNVSPSAVLLCLADTPVYACDDLTGPKK